MSPVSRDTGVMTALLQRLVNERLPKVLAVKEKVDRGNVLDDFDVAFLTQALADCKRAESIMQRDPQFDDIAARMMHLYKEICDRALANEQAQQGSRE